MGDALTAARTWLRECPLIDKNDRFNVNYLGDRAVEYALTLASETHKEDVCGYDIATYNMVFLARLPFGAHMGTNVELCAGYFFLCGQGTPRCQPTFRRFQTPYSTNQAGWKGSGTFRQPAA